jgi:hypothetical protein
MNHPDIVKWRESFKDNGTQLAIGGTLEAQDGWPVIGEALLAIEYLLAENYALKTRITNLERIMVHE